MADDGTARRLDLDDVGTEIGEQLAHLRAHPIGGHINNSKPRERTHPYPLILHRATITAKRKRHFHFTVADSRNHLAGTFLNGCPSMRSARRADEPGRHGYMAAGLVR